MRTIITVKPTADGKVRTTTRRQTHDILNVGDLVRIREFARSTLSRERFKVTQVLNTVGYGDYSIQSVETGEITPLFPGERLTKTRDAFIPGSGELEPQVRRYQDKFALFSANGKILAYGASEKDLEARLEQERQKHQAGRDAEKEPLKVDPNGPLGKALLKAKPRGAYPGVKWDDEEPRGAASRDAAPRRRIVIHNHLPRGRDAGGAKGWFSTELQGSKHSPEVLAKADAIHLDHKRGGIGEETMLERLKALGLSRKEIDTLY